MHPRCSCSGASLQELSRLLAHFQEHVSAAILFYSPDSVEHDWEKTALWSTATSLRGVRVIRDINGAEAELFRVYRACRVMEMGGIRQRFQPKEHHVLVLG